MSDFGLIADGGTSGPSDVEVAKASAVRVPFGKYVGKTLGDLVKIGDEGLRYIDWLIGLDDIRRNDLRWAIGVMHAKYSDEIDRAIEESER